MEKLLGFTTWRSTSELLVARSSASFARKYPSHGLDQGVLLYFTLILYFNDRLKPSFEICKRWRMIFVMGSIFPSLNILGIPFIPESPRFLISSGRIDDARQTFRDLHGPAYDFEVTIRG